MMKETMGLEPVHISALEHFSYCPRQCALIHMEQVFDENVFTLRGRLLHERVHEDDEESRGEVRIERGLPVWSEQLGLVGKADVVEFHGETPYPVEYKHGPRRRWGHAELQVCAQAMCLEEMTGQSVPCGAVFFYGSRRRAEVVFDEPLKQQVIDATAAIRQMLAEKNLPPPANDARCRHCSLKDSCLPEVISEPGRVLKLHEALFTEEGE